MTLASLFDGISGFPLAAVLNGIEPVWASEIEDFPIAVAQHRFPAMKHYGDICKLNGSELPPVDIITGGSPCQDLSVAGNRAGLAGERSGLFMEQIRITKEMRCADELRGRAAHLVRPRYFVWENVPGAFSSADGEDFLSVLEETCRIADSTLSVPRPPGGRWEYAGAILGEKFSLAWRVLDAQYWGVPQRRKRIFLVADFGGLTAPQILFEQDSLLRDTAPGQGAWEGTAATAESGAGNPSRPAFLTADDVFAFHINQREETIDLHGVSGALLATTNMQMQTFVTRQAQLDKVAFACNQRDEVRELHDKAVALGAHPGMKQQTFVAGIVSKGNGDCFITEEKHTSLTSGGGQAGQGYPCVLTAGFSHGDGSSARSLGFEEERSPTLTMKTPSILCLNDQGGQRMDFQNDVSGTLRAETGGHQPLVMFYNHQQGSTVRGPIETAPTVAAAYGMGGGNTPLVMEKDDSFCISGNAIDREPLNGGNGIGYQPDICYTLNTMDRHAVFSRQCVDEFDENSDVMSTQSARQHKDATDLILSPDMLIRRLTPLECERLQGFPDGWTDIPGASDTARYKALGNSVAIPCVAYILRGIAYFLSRHCA